jgi:putative flippase GtrA
VPGAVRERIRHLLGPGSGVAGQGARFVLAGGLVMAVYLGVTTALSWGAGLVFQAALAIGFATAVALHFVLQRRFVWRHQDGFALSPRAQAVRYLAVAGSQYALTAAVTSLVPRALDVSPTLVYLVWTVGATTATFLVFGRGVFHPRR